MSAGLRRSTPADAEAMAGVERLAALTAYAGLFPSDAPVPQLARFVERWRRRMAGDDARAAAFCVEDGPIVGTCFVGPDPAEPTRGQLSSLYVVPDRWGKGIGRRLYVAGMGHLVAHGFGRAVLWVLETNVRARRMYEGWGWTPNGERQPVFDGVDEVRYVTTLAEHPA